jgi:hypothetical protein
LLVDNDATDRDDDDDDDDEGRLPISIECNRNQQDQARDESDGVDGAGDVTECERSAQSTACVGMVQEKALCPLGLQYQT